ncbi:hypothetical protein [Natrinema sp. DC36]|uniref:hypothetical protein n=1 Tax=Natrinema sp. DC36 TaxID=2878680 RepID=UPI001CEFB22B|nr:hypothetical protein [Natrinema sp. DC36]
MSDMQPEDYDWRDVDSVLEDLKRDGYTVAEFETSHSDAVESKGVYLKVER